MDPETPKKASSFWRWVVPAIVVLFFVGARQMHPGGIQGLVFGFRAIWTS